MTARLFGFSRHVRRIEEHPYLQESGHPPSVTVIQRAKGRLVIVLDHLLHLSDGCFAFDRVVFGGDWPVCNLGTGSSYAAWVAALKTIVARRSSREQAALFHDNAVEFYGLD